MWFRVDDQFPFHRKTLRAGNAAIGLWVRAGAWLRQQEKSGRASDRGVITVAELRAMGTATEVRRLIDAGLLVPCKLAGENAVRFHDWEEWQPSSDELTGKRDEWKTRKARQRAHRAGDHSTCLPRYCEDAPPPDPALEPPEDMHG